MRVFLLFFILFFTISFSSSADFGGAFSLDYYNNPIEDSAPSPIQSRTVLFFNVDVALFNLRVGTGVLTGDYEVNSEGFPVFNDVYPGFYTVEFDIFAYPGIKIDFTKSFTLGIYAGGGVRLPLKTGQDSEIDENVDVEAAYSWFYTDLRYLFWGGGLYTSIKLPKSETTRLFISGNFNYFVNRGDQWNAGATTGLLWQI